MQRIFTLRDGFLITESQREVQVEEQIAEEAEQEAVVVVEVEEQLAAEAEQEAVETEHLTAAADEHQTAEEPEHQTAVEAKPAEGGEP